MRNGLVIDEDGEQMWYKDGRWHRDDDLPAWIRPSGDQYWYQNGKEHRENGPAFIYVNGEISWWLHGECYTFDEWCIELNKTPKEKAYLALKYC